MLADTKAGAARPFHLLMASADYKVARIMYKGMPAFHEAIYVETSEAGGVLFHVVGSPQEGFKYEKKATSRPEQSKSFYKRFPLGKVAPNKLDALTRVCEGVPPPENVVVEGVTLKKDCRHWIQAVMKKLKDDGILVQ